MAHPGAKARIGPIKKGLWEWNRILFVSRIVVAILLEHGLSAADAKALFITVDAKAQTRAISPHLFGVFLDDQNCAIDGGLYAEMIKNRSFEERPEKGGWVLEQGGDWESTIQVDRTQPVQPLNRTSLRWEIAKGSQGRLALINSGYWGIAIKKGDEYRWSLYAKGSQKHESAFRVSLEGGNKELYGQGPLLALNTNWEHHAGVITSPVDDRKARFVIQAVQKGTIWFDQVSLFPVNTWKHRTNGMRNDIAGMIAELKPAFVRFPGGRSVTGDGFSNAYRWEQTLGQPVRRPGRVDLKGSHALDGIGFNEYLEFCNDMEACPWWVVNCGMTLGAVASSDETQIWLKEASNSVRYAQEYAKNNRKQSERGSSSGQGLCFVEVGDGNGGMTYTQHRHFSSGEKGDIEYENRVPFFLKALKKETPGVQVIANGYLKNSQPDLVDEQLSGDPEWFISSATRYDYYERGQEGICIGRYGCSEGSGKGNLREALCEAVFMTGLERNGDLVRMACYGPLLGHARVERDGFPAIQFDNKSCYGTPSYYVQKLFSQNRGDEELALKVESASTLPQAAGNIGVGCWRTKAEFKDIEVLENNHVVYRAAFNEGLDGWKPGSGEWAAQDGVLLQNSPDDYVHISTVNRKWDNVSLRLKARKLSGEEGFQIRFRCQDDGSGCWWNLGGWRNNCHGIEKMAKGAWPLIGGWPITISDRVKGSIETGRWYDIRVDLSGARIRCFLDQRLIHDCMDPSLLPVAVAASVSKASGDIIIKAVNYSDAPQDAQINLEGIKDVLPDATWTMMASQDPETRNSLDNPMQIVPKETMLHLPGTRFPLLLPSYSVGVLRVKLSKN